MFKLLIGIVMGAAIVCVFGGFAFLASGHKISPHLHSTANYLQSQDR
jgi:hypothetical protein